MSAKSFTPEFSRPLLVDRVPRKGSHEHFQADPGECAKLAKRFSIHALHKLSARLLLMPWRGGGVKVTGTVKAEVERYFLPANKIDDNIEDDADPITNGEIDLGEIVAETLSLELDPYPRKPGESFGEEANN